MHQWLRAFSFFAVVMVTFAAAIARPTESFAQPLEGAGLALDLFEQLEFTRKGADSVAASLDLVTFEDEYCLPPDQPNKDQERAFLKARQAALDTYIARYRTLRTQLLNLITRDNTALKAVLGKFPRGGNPMSPASWSPWQTAFTKARSAINAKRAELESKREKPCRSAPIQEPTRVAPPEPPQGPGIDLPKVEIRNVEIPSVPTRFCSEDEKRTVLARFRAVEFDFYMNYQDAREYHDAIDEALKKGLGNAAALRALLPDAKRNLDHHAKRHDEFHKAYQRALAMPVVDCGEPKQPPAPPVEPIVQPDYEDPGDPPVPARFCNQAAKDATIDALKRALRIALRNFDTANAKISEIGDRISKGDNTKTTSDAFMAASNASSDHYRTAEALRAKLSKAEAMPVVDCGKAETQTRTDTVIESGETPTQTAPPRTPDETRRTREGRGKPVVIDPPKDVQPPPPSGPSSLGFTEDHRPTIAIGGGYVETDTPQQFIGRIVSGGTDFAMIYTPGTLDGFYGEIEGEVPLAHNPWWGTYASLDFGFRYTDVEGDAFRFVEADPGITTGFVWIDPLDPTVPFAVGLGGANLAWEAHASTSSIDAAAMALYMEYRNLAPGLTGSLGVGAQIDFGETEHRTRIENLDFPGFAVGENYDFSTVGFGPRFQAGLDWDGDPEEDGPYPAWYANFRAHVAPMYDWRDLKVNQRATGPLFGGFDHSQHVDFDDDGFNLRYGINSEIGVKFNTRTTAFLKLGWQGQSDAPTIVPADGSLTPAPIRADTDNASEWFIGGGVRIEF